VAHGHRAVVSVAPALGACRRDERPGDMCPRRGHDMGAARPGRADSADAVYRIVCACDIHITLGAAATACGGPICRPVADGGSVRTMLGRHNLVRRRRCRVYRHGRRAGVRSARPPWLVVPRGLLRGAVLGLTSVVIIRKLRALALPRPVAAVHGPTAVETLARLAARKPQVAARPAHGENRQAADHRGV